MIDSHTEEKNFVPIESPGRKTRYHPTGNGMVFEMSIQDFHDQPHDHMYPHHNGGGGGLDYREGSFISEEVKGYQESGVYHSDSQVGTVFIRISVPELKLQVQILRIIFSSIKLEGFCMKEIIGILVCFFGNLTSKRRVK